MNVDLASLPLTLNLALFALFATVVWYAGARLTSLVDTLSERFHFEKSLAGLLVLSLATSLPEVATTLSASVQQNSALVLNNLFGGIALQTAILATADIWARGSITSYPRKANHALEATLLVLMLGLTLVVLLVGEPLSVLHVGLGSVLIGLVFAGVIGLLRWYNEASDWVPVDMPPADSEAVPIPARQISSASDTALVVQSLAACAAILAFGVALVLSAEVIAVQSGLGSGFIGVTLLAGATSLPELSTTITAVRLGAYTMAISNIFGSNLIMLALVLPADLLFLDGPILASASPTLFLAISFGLVVTSIFLVGMIVRRKPKVGPIGADSAMVIAVFLFSLAAYYYVK